MKTRDERQGARTAGGARNTDGTGSPPSRTPGRAETTRRRLLDAARYVIGERGYAAASIVEVARRANTSVGGLYHHFDGKGELFVALWEDFRVEQRRTVARVVADLRNAGETDPGVLFLAGTRTYLESIWAQRDVARIFYAGDTPPGFHLQHRQNLQSWLGRNAVLLNTGQTPAGRALLIIVTTTIAEIGREIVDCADADEADEVGGAALQLIGRLFDFRGEAAGISPAARPTAPA